MTRVEQAALCCLVHGNLHLCVSKVLAPVSVLREAAVCKANTERQLARRDARRRRHRLPRKHRTQNNHLELRMSVSGLAGFTLSKALGTRGVF